MVCTKKVLFVVKNNVKILELYKHVQVKKFKKS